MCFLPGMPCYEYRGSNSGFTPRDICTATTTILCSDLRRHAASTIAGSNFSAEATDRLRLGSIFLRGLGSIETLGNSTGPIADYRYRDWLGFTVAI
jgi:hypothetical protein